MRTMIIPTLLLVVFVSLMGCSQQDNSQLETMVRTFKEQTDVNYEEIGKNYQRIKKTEGQVKENAAGIKENSKDIAALRKSAKKSASSPAASRLAGERTPAVTLTKLGHHPVDLSSYYTVSGGTTFVEPRPCVAVAAASDTLPPRLAQYMIECAEDRENLHGEIEVVAADVKTLTGRVEVLEAYHLSAPTPEPEPGPAEITPVPETAPEPEPEPEPTPEPEVEPEK